MEFCHGGCLCVVRRSLVNASGRYRFSYCCPIFICRSKILPMENCCALCKHWETLKEALRGADPSKGSGILREILAIKDVLALSWQKFVSDCFN